MSGDFNFDFLDDKTYCHKFKYLIWSFCITFSVNIPTRMTPNTSSCIDSIITDISLDSVKVIIIDCDLSDHTTHILFFKCRGYPQKKKHVKFCSQFLVFSTKNKNISIDLVNSADWNQLYHMDRSNPNLLEKGFFKIIQHKFEIAFAVETQTLCRKDGWMTTGLRISRARKRQLPAMSKLSHDPGFIKYVKRSK